MSIRIMNNSASAVLRSYACAEMDGANVVVWLEIAPQHPKVVGAIWASLVNGAVRAREPTPLRIRDEEAGKAIAVRGLARRYHRLTADAPRLAGRARPKFLRLVAPEACKIEAANRPFIALAWPGLSPGTALAAMFERGTPFPIRIGWGEYLLTEAIARGHAAPLVAGGPAPPGYLIEPAPWPEIISDGVRAGRIWLDGEMRPDLARTVLPASPAGVGACEAPGV